MSSLLLNCLLGGEELRTEKWKQESFLLLNPQSMKGVHHDKDHHVFVISFGRLLSLGNHLAIMRPISSIWWCKFLCCTLVKTAAAAARLVGIPPGENRRAFWRDQTLICGKSGCALLVGGNPHVNVPAPLLQCEPTSLDGETCESSESL